MARHDLFNPISPASAFLAALLLAGPALPQPLSPYLFGQNLWHAVHPGDGANRVWARMKEAKFALIRVGGIQWDDEMPAAPQWITWADSIRAIGAEPLFQVSSKQSPEAAAALVRELNVSRKYAIRYWAIGNEPTCGKPAGAAEVAAIAKNIRDRASAMKKADPTIRLLVGDECFWRAELYNALIGGEGGTDITGKDAGGNHYADAISFHSYPFPGVDKNAPFSRAQVIGNGVSGIRGMMKSCVDRTALANATHGRAGAQALGCALTEFNVTYWNSSDNTPRGVGVRSFLNGQFVAEVFGSGIEYGFLTVAPWSMFEAGGDGSGSDLGMFDGAGPFNPRPYYHHIKMMSAFMGGRFVPSSDNVALVKTYATQDADRSAILLLNQSETAGQAFTLKFKADAPVKANPLIVTLAVGYPGEHVDSIGPQESLLLQVHASGKILARSVYNVRMAEQNAAPRTDTYPVPSSADRAPRAEEGLGAVRAGMVRAGGYLAGNLAGGSPEGNSYVAVLADLEGRTAARSEGMGTTWRLATAALPGGVYILTLRSGKESVRRKIAIGP